MIYLGKFKAGDTVFYAANFHNDTGTIENPTSPEAQIRNSAGVWSVLTAPAIQNAKTGHYGGTIDTTGYSVGQHIIRMAGTVATAKTVATEFCFTIVANIESDTYLRLGAPAGASVSVDIAAVKTDTTAILDDTGTNGVVVAATSKTGYSISGTKTTLDVLNDITAASVWTVGTRTLTSFGTLVSDIWANSSRTLTAFSTSLALSVWDVLETAILTASSIGLKVKNNLDATISSRASHTAADVWTVGTRTLTSFGTLVSDIWANSSRTLTAFSTSLALSVWDVLETAILTASSIGLKVKNNLDALISSRFATSGYIAPDNAGISSILTESQSHPTLGEIEASIVIAKEATSSAIKTKTDTIIWGDITDIKNVNMGKWSINKTTSVLTMYKADGVTVLKTFNLTDNSSVSERVPV